LIDAWQVHKGLSLQGQGQEHNFVLNDNQGSRPRTTSVINATLDHRYNALWYNTDLITTWLHVFMDCPELDIHFIISESRSYTVLRPTKWAGALSTSPLEGGRPVGPSTMHSVSIEWLVLVYGAETYVNQQDLQLARTHNQLCMNNAKRPLPPHSSQYHIMIWPCQRKLALFC